MKTDTRTYWQEILQPWLAFYKGIAPFAILIVLCSVLVTPTEVQGIEQSDAPPIVITTEIDESTLYEQSYCAYSHRRDDEMINFAELDPAEALLYTHYRDGFVVNELQFCAMPYFDIGYVDDYIVA